MKNEMSYIEAIKHLEYMKESWTEQNSVFWNAFEKGIDALKKIDDVQRCLERRNQNDEC